MMGRELHPSALHTSRDLELMPSSHWQTPPHYLAKMGGAGLLFRKVPRRVCPLPGRCPDPQVTLERGP